jgi:hypothetical protein
MEFIRPLGIYIKLPSVAKGSNEMHIERAMYEFCLSWVD